MFNGDSIRYNGSKKSAERLVALNAKLVESARSAGMAEVASSVLHNVGNVLNSINVISLLLWEKIGNSNMHKLKKVVLLLEEHSQDMDMFISQNPQGKQIPKYLSKLAELWDIEHKNLLSDLSVLTSHVQHIKDIVSTHQSLGRSIGSEEAVKITDVLNDALIISDLSSNLDVEIKQQCESVSPIFVDRLKVLQILINLIKNARDAMKTVKSSQKILHLSCNLNSMNEIEIHISDTGIGIKPENMNQIFNYGFTTKPNGNGYGLHSSAIAARQMGGSLTVESAGENQGTTFTLRLPNRTK